MRKRLTAALALACSVALASACSSGSSSGNKSELKLYNDKGAWKQYFADLGKQSKKDIKLGMKPVGYTDENAYQAFITASFRTKVKPDLFTWSTGGRLEELVKQKQVADTSDLWSDAISKGYLPSALKKYYTVSGKQYCVPLNVSYWVMFYNKKVFADAGVQPPKTWDEFTQVNNTLKTKGVTPMYQTSTLFSFVWFEQLLVGTNPDLYDKLATGKAKYTDPDVVKVMQMYQDEIGKGWFSNPGEKTDPANMLKTGKVAMVPFGTWFNTSLTQLGMKAGSDYDFFTIPNVNASLPKTSLVFETGPLCYLAKAPDLKASEKYAKWWLTPSAQTPWANSRGDVSANPKVKIPNPALNTLNSDAGGSKYRLMNRYFEAAPPPVLTAALDALGAFMVNPGTYQKQLETIQKAAEDYWSQQK
jgi:multiple sugar transport system substrate-binding protein